MASFARCRTAVSAVASVAFASCSASVLFFSVTSAPRRATRAGISTWFCMYAALSEPCVSVTHSAERTKVTGIYFAPLKGSFATLERGGYAPFDGIPPISARSKRCLWAPAGPLHTS